MYFKRLAILREAILNPLSLGKPKSEFENSLTKSGLSGKSCDSLLQIEKTYESDSQLFEISSE